MTHCTLRATSRVTFVLISAVLATAAAAHAQDARMNFFITGEGPGDGANLGGLRGADEHCAMLGYRAGFGDLTWRAYLSTQAREGQPAVNARDRIGTGPWYNFRGDLIARNVDELHGENNLNKQTGLTEKGEQVPGRGDSPNRHDILTGSRPDGTAPPAGDDATCDNWTSSGAGSAIVGHHDRVGLGDSATSWNSAHGSRGCSAQNLQGSGGAGLFYCFGT